MRDHHVPHAAFKASGIKFNEETISYALFGKDKRINFQSQARTHLRKR
jgi:hypothetical protein